jgi:glutathione peroxidase
MADLAEMWKYATMLVAAFGMTVSPPVAAGSNSGFSFAFRSIEGDELPLAKFAGKPLLVVNTASECGYTPQYKDLVELWQKYRDKGLVVLGVPSNDFGGQEPGSNKEIADFCRLTYGVKFPMLGKSDVVGSATNPLYKQLASITGEKPKWNFHKYLIDRSGQKVLSFPSTTAPDSKTFVTAVERALAERP